MKIKDKQICEREREKERTRLMHEQVKNLLAWVTPFASSLSAISLSLHTANRAH